MTASQNARAPARPQASAQPVVLTFRKCEAQGCTESVKIDAEMAKNPDSYMLKEVRDGGIEMIKVYCTGHYEEKKAALEHNQAEVDAGRPRQGYILTANAAVLGEEEKLAIAREVAKGARGQSEQPVRRLPLNGAGEGKPGHSSQAANPQVAPQAPAFPPVIGAGGDHLPPPAHGGPPPPAHGGPPPPAHGGPPPPAHGGYPPPAHGGYPPPAHGGYPPAPHGGYPPAPHVGYPPAPHGEYPPAPHGGYPPAPHGGYPHMYGYPPPGPYFAAPPGWGQPPSQQIQPPSSAQMPVDKPVEVEKQSAAAKAPVKAKEASRKPGGARASRDDQKASLRVPNVGAMGSGTRGSGYTSNHSAYHDKKSSMARRAHSTSTASSTVQTVNVKVTLSYWIRGQTKEPKAITADCLPDVDIDKTAPELVDFCVNHPQLKKVWETKGNVYGALPMPAAADVEVRHSKSWVPYNEDSKPLRKLLEAAHKEDVAPVKIGDRKKPKTPPTRTLDIMLLISQDKVAEMKAQLAEMEESEEEGDAEEEYEVKGRSHKRKIASGVSSMEDYLDEKLLPKSASSLASKKRSKRSTGSSVTSVTRSSRARNKNASKGQAAASDHMSKSIAPSAVPSSAPVPPPSDKDSQRGTSIDHNGDDWMDEQSFLGPQPHPVDDGDDWLNGQPIPDPQPNPVNVNHSLLISAVQMHGATKDLRKVVQAKDIGLGVDKQLVLSVRLTKPFDDLNDVTRTLREGAEEDGSLALLQQTEFTVAIVRDSERESEVGSFKQAWFGRAAVETSGVKCISRAGKICVKQAVVFRPNGGNGEKPISRVIPGDKQAATLLMELECLVYGSALLELAKDFVRKKHAADPTLYDRYPEGGMPPVRFVNAAIGQDLRQDKSSPKTFLLEEEIEQEAHGHFVKYVHNRKPIPVSGLDKREKEIAEYLCFTQHVQYWKTGKLMFVTDYQGAGGLLTDPQIISAPILGDAFAGGNIEDGYTNFEVYHVCGVWCELFEVPDWVEIPDARKNVGGH
ncbi:hypothetical protein EIP91_002206 [Steccherinum ochraceum]|uniref:Alpha-type protein kinase domain-containing protein n=1 Tax=Steccherinum ochraceum TaxID=92696 RepID=A0A4V2MWC9_9APHY|nr:hypothetical protein EIP91_002206 [Steccherinum ochraceum]